MKILYKYILKELAKPFFGSLIVIIMVLLSNFILKNIDKFLGKGISMVVVMKFIFLNSAWIFSLAVPMAILITTLMTFGRLASDNEITAFKASGITFFEILKPGILFGVMLIVFMIPYNLWLLPEMNHSMKKLSYEISRSRPDVEFNEQLLNSLADKIIYVGKRLSNNSFNDIIIFDNKNINIHTTILSENGRFHALQDGIILDLNNGSIHEHIIESDEYRKTYFNNYKIAVPFKDLNFNSDNLTRREREMNIHLLTEKITYYKDEIDKINEKNISNTETLDSLNQLISNLDKIGPEKDMLLYKRTQNKINKVNIEQKRNMKLIPKHKKEVYKYGVEVHKKFTLPFACLFFIFLGTPLGIMARKGNMSISIGVSLIFFIIYWSFLIIGENLADNGQLNPAIAMWLPNIIVGITAYYLYKMYSNENKSFKFNLKFLNKNKK